ncbi:GRAM-domain-containing protein, partial [Ramicandelaber brevisporus]
KRNLDFHALFRNTIPEDEHLVADYACALHRDILVHGRLYFTENTICFYSNILGWVTRLTVSFAEVVAIDKRMTAFVIPNALQISTLHQKYFFASLVSRDKTYDQLMELWNKNHP